jgi:hypothetical protein
MFVFGLSNVVFLLATGHRFGYGGPLPFMIAVMAFYTFIGLRGFLESRSVYSYDEERIERRHAFRTESMRWADVVDFKIRRSSGDASIFLTDRGGRKLRLDLQLLGEKSGGVLETLTRHLRPLIDEKLLAIETEPREFTRKHVGLLPVPGGVTAGGGLIRGGGVTVRLAELQQIAVREVKKLVYTQQYEAIGSAGRVRFLSFVDDSPLLIAYLRRQVPEQKWAFVHTEGVFLAKLSALALVPVMAFSALVTVAAEVPMMVVDNVLSTRSRSASGTVVENEKRGRSVRVAYTFEATDGRQTFGEATGLGTAPAAGQPVRVRFDPRNPSLNRPDDGQGFEVPSPWSLLGPMLAQLLLSLPYAMAVLLVRVRPDPFSGWLESRISPA